MMPPPLQEVVLKATRIKKSFYHPVRVDVLEEVSLELHRGETLAVMGASGEGKTTLLHILGTLDQADEGTLEIGGHVVTASASDKIRNWHVGFVFQTFNLLDDYTAIENVLIPARIARRKTSLGSKAHEQAKSLLQQVGLVSRADFPIKLLSGGEKQRVALARALCNDPDIILADEPSGNLDRQTSRQIHQLLIDTAKNHGKGLIIVTHDNELAALCDHIYCLEDGILCCKR